MAEKNTARIDKWLFAMRVFKTRSLANEACSRGKVKIDYKTVKASRMVREGDIIQVRLGVVKFKYQVLKIAENRMGAKMLKNFIVDLTSAKELAKLKTSKSLSSNIREKGKGRPTKKERRIIDKLRGKY